MILDLTWGKGQCKNKNGMRKYWPLVLLIVGVLVVGLVWFLVIRGRGEKAIIEEEEMVADIPLDRRPVVALIPRVDGHWLDLIIEDIKVEAASLDYEVLYQTATGITQGVPGMVKLEGESKIEREILLGSESSGKFRYDEGVKEGTLTIKFRDEKGKLVGKLVTDWSLGTGGKELTSIDGKLTFKAQAGGDEYFVIMESFGMFGVSREDVKGGPYGVFCSDPEMKGTVEMEGEVLKYESGDWRSVTTSTKVGYFVAVGE